MAAARFAGTGLVLRDPAFARWWAGSTISLFGDQFYLVALPWLVLQLTSSSVTLSTILVAAAVPRAALMLAGGAVTDARSPKTILTLTAAARAALVVTLAVLVFAHAAAVWQLYVLAAAFGIADAFAMPASRALLPSVVPAESLQPANSLVQTSAQLSTIAGPLPAGLAIRAWGLGTAFLIDAVSFLFVIGALLGLPDPPPRAAQARTSVWASVVAGLRYVAGDRPLATLTLLAATINFCLAGPSSVGLVLVAQQRFGAATGFAALVSALALGSLAGTIAAGIARITPHRGLVLLAGAAAIGAVLAAVPFAPGAPALIALLAAMGAISGFVNVTLQTWLQLRISPEMRGRAFSLLMFATFGLLPLSLAVAGVLARSSVALLFVVSGATVIAVAVAAFFAGGIRAVR